MRSGRCGRSRGERVLGAVAARGGADERTLLATLSALRGAYDPELVSAALTQARLRERARAKFGADAARMFFTPDGVEQATRPVVAAHRAGRFAGAGAGRVLDLCCGIGGDLLGFGRAGLAAHGVDRDPLTVEVARANAATLGLRELRLSGDAAATVVLTRVAGRRTALLVTPASPGG